MLADKKIRLIGIWDNVDTAKAAPGETFQIQLENIVNNMYLRDASRKVHSAFDNLRKRGMVAKIGWELKAREDVRSRMERSRRAYDPNYPISVMDCDLNASINP